MYLLSLQIRGRLQRVIRAPQASNTCIRVDTVLPCSHSAAAKLTGDTLRSGSHLRTAQPTGQHHTLCRHREVSAAVHSCCLQQLGFLCPRHRLCHRGKLQQQCKNSGMWLCMLVTDSSNTQIEGLCAVCWAGAQYQEQ